MGSDPGQVFSPEVILYNDMVALLQGRGQPEVTGWSCGIHRDKDVLIDVSDHILI